MKRRYGSLLAGTALVAVLFVAGCADQKPTVGRVIDETPSQYFYPDLRLAPQEQALLLFFTDPANEVAVAQDRFVSGIATSMAGKVRVARIDVSWHGSDGRDFAAMIALYGVRYTPTFVLRNRNETGYTTAIGPFKTEEDMLGWVKATMEAKQPK